ncbi:MAG: hypothetical protein V1918_06695 [Planctomycetota bacterium]
MNETLKEIRILQSIDTDLLALRRRLKTGPQEEEEARQRLEEARARLAAGEEAVRRERSAADAADLEVKRIETEIDRLKNKLVFVKNNKEYSILHSGIDEAHRRMGDFETAELERLEKIDVLKAEGEALRALVREEEAALARLQAALRVELSALEAEVETIRGKRKLCADRIDPETLDLYEKVIRSGQGVAVVEMKDGICQGCYRRLTPNVESQIHVGNLVVRCQGCNRFLFYNNGDTPPEKPA